MLFFVIITFTLLNIIFGIIIDTFAELRDAKKKIDEDINNKCFICSLDRYTVSCALMLSLKGMRMASNIIRKWIMMCGLIFISSFISKPKIRLISMEPSRTFMRR